MTNSKDMFIDVLNVLDHKYGSMVFNVPNSVWGIFYYLFMFYIHNNDFPEGELIFNNLNLISCIGGMYLWYLMIFKIKSVCALCMTVHASNFLTFASIFV